MEVAFSTKDPDVYLEAAENQDTGHVTLFFVSAKDRYQITVEAGDLARTLVAASPTFATGLGEIAQRAILSVLGRDE